MSRLSVGVVGAGHIAATHVKAWRKTPGFRVETVFDLDRAAAEARAAALRVPNVADSLDELLDTSDVVDICTPPQSHAALAARSLEADCHLVVEKPIVTSAAEWESLRPRIEASSRAVAVIHNLKFSRSIQTALQWVAGGRIGRILRFERYFLTHPDRDRMLVADEHWSHGLPGGRWFETLPHALYLSYAFLGGQRLEHVAAHRTDAAPRGAPADEVVIVLAGSGSFSTIHYSANCPPNRRDVRIQGTEGAIDIDVLADAAFLYRHSDSKWQRATTANFRRAVGTAARWLPDRAGFWAGRVRGLTPHSRLIGAFGRHVRGLAGPPTPLSEIDYVVTMTERIGRAIEESAA